MKSRNTRLLKAAFLEPVDRTPVWFMRQIGRYQREYREYRAKYKLLDIFNNAELAAELTLLPFKQTDFDGAVIFADILPPLISMGLDLQFTVGSGPYIDNPITCPADVDRLAAPPAEESMPSTLRAVEIASAELAGRGIPVIGFCGAPFTLASYALEGGGSRNYERVKSFMYSQPAAWQRLMNKLVTVLADFAVKQTQAGAAIVQIFDSWVGLATGEEDYLRFIQPHNKALFDLLQKNSIPSIHFSTGTSGYLDVVAQTGGDVISVDWRVSLSKAWRQIGNGKAIQGNLDPIALMAPWRELQFHIDRVLDSVRGRTGHIFNLGHGILPNTPVDHVRRAVDYVHERTGAGK
ncbi:MAG: uroporphyrinogen decarboxylase [Chitinivibrionales bacterium]|nr:uroporphyrinogen decarboxylase [Chitinivibrionales bacterium]